MRLRYVLMITFSMFICNISPAMAGSVTVPYIFTSGAKAMASEVNTNFKVLETEVNDNDSHIAELEAARSYTVFALGEALQFLPESSITVEDLLATAQRVFDLTLIQYGEGFFNRVDEICQWSKRWQDIAYLAASDDAGRLTALEDHLERMESVYDIAELRFMVGVVTEVDPLTAEYYLLSANALVEGFNAKTENSQ